MKRILIILVSAKEIITIKTYLSHFVISHYYLKVSKPSSINQQAPPPRPSNPPPRPVAPPSPQPSSRQVNNIPSENITIVIPSSTNETNDLLNINQSPKITKPSQQKLPPKEPSFDLLGAFESNEQPPVIAANTKEMPDILSKF